MTDLKPKNSYPVMRIDADGTHEVNERVASERGASIRLCSVPVVRLQCLPEGVDDLAVGFLYSEAILTDPAQLRGVSVSEDGETVVDVDADMDVVSLEGIHEKMLLTSGCGRGASLDNLDDLDLLMDCRKRFDLSVSMKAARLLELMEDFRKRSELFKATGGVHSAALVDENQVFTFAEDIGRHNAVDKVIGWAVRNGHPLQNKTVLTTGRLSFDIVAKVVRVGIPILASRSAPTDSAVDLAAAFHVALLGFVRGKRMNVYSARFRIKS